MKVNDYVRTTNGYIGKIFNINEYREPTLKYGILTNYIDMVDTHFIGEEDIAKSSPNIIDLIEVCDYVNGCEVLDKYNYDNCDSHLIVNGNGFNVIMVADIKEIVTKEQFERCEYKI